MNKTNFPAVIFLDRQSLSFGASGMEAPLNLNFDEEHVADLDIKKTDLVNDKIRLFVEENKLVPGPLLTLLSPQICVSKVFSEGIGETKKEEIKKFLDLVPFENIRSKTFPFEKGFKLYAVNRDYYEIIEAAFEKMGFRVEATMPADLVGIENLNKENLLQIYKKLNFIKQNTISGPVVMPGSSPAKKDLVGKNKNLLIMLAVLALGVLVLVATIIIADPFGFGKKPKVIEQTMAPQVKVIPAPAPEEATPAAQIPIDKLRVQIINGNARELFLSLGFKEVTVVTAKIPNAKTNLGYTASVSAQILDTVTAKLKEKYPNLTASPSSNLDFSLILTVGK